MDGPAKCVASVTSSTTGAASRLFVLLQDPGRLREVDAFVSGGTGSYHPVVVKATSIGTVTGTLTSYLMNGLVHSTTALVTAASDMLPDPSNSGDNPMQADTAHNTTTGVSTYRYIWEQSQAPSTVVATGSGGNSYACVVLQAVGTTANTATMGLRIVWEPASA